MPNQNPAEMTKKNRNWIECERDRDSIHSLKFDLYAGVFDFRAQVSIYHSAFNFSCDCDNSMELHFQTHKYNPIERGRDKMRQHKTEKSTMGIMTAAADNLKLVSTTGKSNFN